LHERVVVAFVLIGVGLGELRALDLATEFHDER
jgi:hypothetical protein